MHGIVFWLALSGLGTSATPIIPVSPLAIAQPLTTPRFWTPGTKSLVAADSASKLADLVFTSRYMKPGRVCYLVDASRPATCLPLRRAEGDPLARPFVTHGEALRISFFAGLEVADIAVAYALHRHHHDKIARTVLMLGMADNAVGAFNSAMHHRGSSYVVVAHH